MTIEISMAMDTALILRMGSHEAETPKIKDLYFLFMCFYVALIHSISFIFTIVHKMMELQCLTK